MIHTPVHASWLNQVEISFSVVQRKVVAPNDVTDLAQVEDRLRAFEDRYNATAQPFQWTFTTSHLDDLLARLDRPQPAEGVWAHLKNSLRSLVPCSLDELAALARTRLERMQYQPDLLDGFIARPD
jgi:hypothetical protein